MKKRYTLLPLVIALQGAALAASPAAELLAAGPSIAPATLPLAAPAAAPAAAPSAPSQDNYLLAVSSADAALKRGDYAAALKFAQDAIHLSDRQFLPYYYGAIALFQQGMQDEAENYARRAEAFAKNDNKEAAAQLVERIVAKRTAAKKIAEGDQALIAGRKAKAALAYAAAWDGAGDPEIGLKAAELMIDATEEIAEAAKILRAIAATSKDPAVANQAATLLAAQQKRLTEFRNQQMTLGREAFGRGDMAQASQAFDQAALAAPTDKEAYLALIEAFGQLKDTDKTLDAFTRAANQAKLVPDDIAKNKGVFTLLGNPEIAALMPDLYGPKAAKQLIRAYETSVQNAAKEKQDLTQKLASLREQQRDVQRRYTEFEAFKDKDCSTGIVTLALTVGLASLSEKGCQAKKDKAVSLFRRLEEIKTDIASTERQLAANAK